MNWGKDMSSHMFFIMCVKSFYQPQYKNWTKYYEHPVVKLNKWEVNIPLHFPGMRG